jgi:hypothetical protein
MIKSISVSYLKTLISSKIINLLRFRGKDTKIIYDTCFHSSWTLSINGCPFSLHKNQHLGLCRACSIQGLSAAAHSDRPTLQQKHRTTSLSPAICSCKSNYHTITTTTAPTYVLSKTSYMF